MNVPKQFINLLGAVLIVAILVAGVLLGALPLYSAAQETDASTRTIQQTNSVYETQVAQLTEAEADIVRLDGSVAALRSEIAGIPQLDDVFEIVIAAAEETTTTIQSVSATAPVPFAPRAPLDADGLVVTAPPVTETPATSDASAQNTDAPTDVPSAAPEDSPQLQIPITITMTVADAAQATAFVDALGRGPRLIAPLDMAFSAGTLTVNALAFIRTDDAS